MAAKDVESQQPSILSQGRTMTLDFTDEQRRALNTTLALISIIIYFSATSFVPIVNKAILTSAGHNFPYPLATGFLQLGFVSFMLTVFTSLRYLRKKRRGSEISWVFGPHLGYKLRTIALPGIAFGMKFGVTNWGLRMMPTGIHLLLQASDLAWTLLIAKFCLEENPGRQEIFAAVLSTAGAVLVAYQGTQSVEAPLIPVLVNLLIPLMMAIVVVFLRRTTVELRRRDNCLGGRITPAEITAIKLAFSAFVCLLLACLMENGHVQLATGSAQPQQQPAWWDALCAGGLPALLTVLSGGCVVTIFQLNLTWLSTMVSACTIGIIGGAKIVPQYFVNAMVTGQFKLNVLDVSGVALVCSGALLYTAARVEVKFCGCKGFKGFKGFQGFKGFKRGPGPVEQREPLIPTLLTSDTSIANIATIDFKRNKTQIIMDDESDRSDREAEEEEREVAPMLLRATTF
ncbi:unnamed protein product [Symbiodinium sp. CCMP2456]|nr:unnamed protein product [Symbiodinium sp. CCMP2456]